jgi:hypothetical protein
VGVEVGYLLSAAGSGVENCSITVVFEPQGLGGEGNSLEKLSNLFVAGLSARKIPKVLARNLRNDQDVGRGLGLYVPKGQDVFVLEYYIGGDFAAQNLMK